MPLNVREFRDFFPKRPINTVQIGKAVVYCRWGQFEIIFLTKGPYYGCGTVIRAGYVSRCIEGNDVIRNLDLNVASRLRWNPNLNVIFCEFRLAGKRKTPFYFFAAQLSDDLAGQIQPASFNLYAASAAYALAPAKVTDVYACMGCDIDQFFA